MPSLGPSLGRPAAKALVLAALLSCASQANAYVISIVGAADVHGRNLSVTASGGVLTLNDFFDQYDQTRWEIASAVEDARGGILVDYTYPEEGTWDSYSAFAEVEFQILAESGDLTPQPVEIDLWGASFYRHETLGACCFSESPTVEVFGSGIPNYYAPDGDNAIASSHVLMSNTSYRLNYFNTQYVEGTPLGSWLPRYFESRDLYDAFLADRGASGLVYASAQGSINYNLALRGANVPEPGTFGLLGCALVGLLLARRRPAAKLSRD